MKPRPCSAPGPDAHQVFNILVREHAPMLLAYLRSLLYSSGAVDDLFQETMLVAWRKLADMDQSQPFGPWLRAVAGRLVLEHRRKSAARGQLSCDPQMLRALELEFLRFESLPGESFRHRLDRLSGCIDKLPSPMREVIGLVYDRGLSLRSLAMSLNAAEETIKKRLQRARHTLADCLQGIGGMP